MTIIVPSNGPSAGLKGCVTASAEYRGIDACPGRCHRDTEAQRQICLETHGSQLLPYAEASRVSKIDRGDTGQFAFAPKTRGTAHAFVYRMEEQPDPVTSRIIGCAITLHRFLGPGLLESVYHIGLAVELARAQIPFESKRHMTITYHDVPLGEFVPDFIVENQVIVEVNQQQVGSVEEVTELVGAAKEAGRPAVLFKVTDPTGGSRLIAVKLG